MNLLECYIIEVHDIKVRYIPEDLATIGYFPELVYDVTLTYDYYGSIKTATLPFTESEWKDAKEKGYFMA